MLIACIILAAVLTISLYINYNLLKKVERYEDDIMVKDEFIQKLQSMTVTSYTKLKELDINEAFESDDEVGHFFINLKQMIVTIDAYFKNYTK